jgi:capsule polysaccharide export protein KpsE/RkpR
LLNQKTYINNIKLFLENKKIIFLFTGLTLILSILYVIFILDPIFLSKAKLKSSNSSGGLSSLISQSLPDLGDIGDLAGGIGGGSSSKALALYENILLSRRCVEETINKFGLMDAYKIEKMEDAVKLFRTELIVIEKDKPAGTLEIGIYDKDPVKAKDMVQFLVDQLNKLNTELNVQDAKNHRVFIEGRAEIIKEDLKKTEDKMEEYQNKYGIAPDLMVKAVTQSQIQLEVDIKTEEVKLDLLKKMVSPNEPEVISQQNKIDALKKQLAQTQNSNFGDDLLSLKGSPSKIIEYIRLARNIEIQNKLLAFITPVLEQAKIEENNKTPSLLILDYPNVPDKKAKPKRVYIVLALTFIAFICAYLYFYIRYKFKELKAEYRRQLNQL